MAAELRSTWRPSAVVAREGSFTRAAAQLGVSQSALSQTIRAPGSTGSACGCCTAPRAAWRRPRRASACCRTVGPRLEEHRGRARRAWRAARQAGRHRPHHRHRTRRRLAALAEAGAAACRDYPDIKVEISIDYRLIDIVAERFDAGVRLGEHVAKDMIAVRIGARHADGGGRQRRRISRAGRPPQTPQDLTEHDCINLRLPTHGGLLPGSSRRAGAN